MVRTISEQEEGAQLMGSPSSLLLRRVLTGNCSECGSETASPSVQRPQRLEVGGEDSSSLFCLEEGDAEQ